MSVSPSSPAAVRTTRKVRENLELFSSYARGRQKGSDLDDIFATLEEYDLLMRRYAQTGIDGANVVEVGFGARPHRLLAMLAQGADIIGCDLEVPLLHGRFSELRQIQRSNGTERMVKSLVRYMLFDHRERRRLAARLASQSRKLSIDASRLRICDAAHLRVEPQSADVVISEDVFEHVDAATLPALVETMHGWLKPTGVALIRPNVFTGITGGHQNEWGRWSFRGSPPRRRSVAWDHLLDRQFAPNSFLNELWLRDYRAVFEERFEILEEIVTQPGLGREHLTDEVRARLEHLPEEELFSNRVLFALRPRP